MKVGKIMLQMSGIDLASLKEKEILELIKAQCKDNGEKPDDIGEVNVYINIEGTAVTAYYTCGAHSGAVRLN